MTDPTPAAAPPLPQRALQGQRIGISVSDSPDLARLGLTPLHLQLAVRELARTVLIGGGTLAYGGNLKVDGFTKFLVGELGQYARAGLLGAGEQDRALLLCLSWQEHRRNTLAHMDEVDAQLDLYGEIRCLDPDGQLIMDRTAGRGADAEPDITDEALLARGRTGLRSHLTACTAARMLIGGRRHNATGSCPGLIEEALLALQAGQPLYLAGGFGGTALDIATVVDARCASVCPPQAGDPPPAPAAAAGLDALRALIGGAGWQRLDNGLSEAENLHLAMTHRPAEIASLVGLGLGRWAQRRRA